MRSNGGPWSLLCRAPSQGECWECLLRLRPSEPGHIDLTVNEGRNPEHRDHPPGPDLFKNP